MFFTAAWCVGPPGASAGGLVERGSGSLRRSTLDALANPDRVAVELRPHPKM